MSATVDSLSIKVYASARGANQQLDKLVQKMMQLRSTVNGINVGNLNTMAASLQNFSKAASGLSQVKTSDFTRMAKSIEKLSKMSKIDMTVSAFSINRMSKALTKFSNINLGDKSKQISSFVRAIGNLKGENINSATKELPALAKALRSSMRDLSKMPDVSQNILGMTRALGNLNGRNISGATEFLPKLTKELKNMMSELSKAPTVSNNIIAMTNAMANLGAQASGIRSLGSAMNSAGTRGNGFFGTMKKGISNIKSFASNIRSATTHNRSFASTLGLLYAKFWTLQRGIGALGNAVKSSMDYIEEYNYFNVTMEKIASEWSDDFKKYGYENGDAYGKSFQNRVTEIMNKMTGFQMNDDGTLMDSQNKNLGLDVTQMTNYAAGVAQVTNSVGLTGEASIVTSKALSMLAGDMSSFRNLDMQTVMTNFSSGLIGQSRALYKYGIDITNATLATYAHEMGIKKDITAMTQGEKMQLRMIAILDQSKVAWGDLANTINSPSNQLRLLNNNFKALARTVGNIFLPVVAKVLPYVNGLVIAIRRLFEWTASMLGIDLKEVIGDSGAGYSDAFEGLEDDADNASNAVDNTTDSVKKLAKQLMGFDELNVINTNDSSKSNSNNNPGSGDTIDLTDQLSNALADYEKVWNEAYENMTNDAEKFADKLTKLFKDAWISGDGSDIGSAIAKWLNNGLKWVNDNWSIADEKVQKIANILATAVNGFTYEFDWSGLGTALSNTLQTWLDGQTTFFDKTDWKALGKGIATSLNSFIGDGKNGPIESYFKNLGSKLRAAIEFAFGLITTFDFKNLGTAIGQGINDFLDKMGKVDKKTGLNGWQELAKTISVGISGISTTITTALNKVKWEEVGQAIADFISNIDWDKVIWDFGTMVKSFKKSLKRTLKGAGMNDTIAEIVVDVAIVGWIIKKISKKSLTAAIGTAVGSKFSAKIGKVVVNIKKWALAKIGIADLKKAISSKIKSIPVTIKKVFVAIKEWKIAKQAGESVSLVSKLKSAIGISDGAINLGNIATKLSLKAPTIVFPDPVTDEIERNIEDWITKQLEKLPFYDKENPAKGWQFIIPIAEMFTIGKIAFKENDETGKSAIQEAFDAFMTGGEGGTPSITALVKYLTDESEINKTNKKIKDKKIEILYESVTSKNWKSVYNKYKNLKDKAATTTLKVQYANSATKAAMQNPLLTTKGKVDAINKTIRLSLKLNGKNVSNNDLANLAKLVSDPNFIKSNPYNAKISKKAGGGIFSGGSWHNIAKYAGGGLPGMGQMFVARESGPELVGTIGGHTSVMNNNQIVASVSDGVFNALNPVLTSLVNAINTMATTSSNGNGDVYVQIDGDNIARVVRRKNLDYKKRTGRGMFD